MKRKTITLIAIFLLTFLSSVLNQRFKGLRDIENGLFFGSMLLFTVLAFLWVYYDSADRNYYRSSSMNIGVVALPVVFVPVYLVKSRPAGTRLKALGWFGIVAFLYLFVSLVGEYCAKVVRV